MSFILPLKHLHSEQKTLIKTMCVAKPKATPYELDPEPVFMFDVDRERDEVVLPLGMYKHFMPTNPNAEYAVRWAPKSKAGKSSSCLQNWILLLTEVPTAVNISRSRQSRYMLCDYDCLQIAPNQIAYIGLLET